MLLREATVHYFDYATWQKHLSGKHKNYGFCGSQNKKKQIIINQRVSILLFDAITTYAIWFDLAFDKF